MFLLWAVGATILYWVFKNWEATHKHPFISALLWPLIIVFSVVMVIWLKITGGKNNAISEDMSKKSQSSLSDLPSINKPSAMSSPPKISLCELLEINITDKTKEQRSSLCEHLLSISKDTLFQALDYDNYKFEKIENSIFDRQVPFNNKFIVIHNLFLLKKERQMREMMSSDFNGSNFDPRTTGYGPKNLECFDLFSINENFNMISISAGLSDPKDIYFFKMSLVNLLVGEILP